MIEAIGNMCIYHNNANYQTGCIIIGHPHVYSNIPPKYFLLYVNVSFKSKLTPSKGIRSLDHKMLLHDSILMGISLLNLQTNSPCAGWCIGVVEASVFTDKKVSCKVSQERLSFKSMFYVFWFII